MKINTKLPGILFRYLLLLALLYAYPSPAQSLISDGTKILFVGNGKVGSEGGLHNHFRRTMEQMDQPIAVETDWIAMYGMQTLDEMLTNELVERIKNGDDEIIVVQSGDIPALETFAELISESGKRMVVYGIWPDNPWLPGNSFEAFTREITDHYKKLMVFQRQHGIPVAPCGLAYQNLMVKKPVGYTLRNDFLFTPESSNTNDLSCMVNVSMLYSVLTGENPVGLPMWNPFPESLVAQIQAGTFEIYNLWKDGEIMTVTRENMETYVPENEVSFSGQPLWSPLLTDSSNIYYVGNSYIGTEGGLENHFPRLLREVGSEYQPRTRSSIFWGQGLQRMFTGEVRRNIKDGPEDIMVVTSGPREYLDKFRQEIAAAGKQMVVHMTWGRNPTLGGMENYQETTMAIVRASKKFENETGVPVIPCGLIYYDLITNPPELGDMELRLDWVFMEENIHQNHIGTMVNAAAHYAVLTGKSPVGLPMWDPYPKELVHAVQQRTWEVVQQWKGNKLNITE